MENLFIIGNGFDLAHGLPTGYGDFKTFLYNQYNLSDLSFDDAEYLEDYEFPELTIDGDGGEVLADIGYYAPVYFKICNNLNEDLETHETDWHNFENNLAKITQIKVDGTDILDTEGDLNYSFTDHLRKTTSYQFNQSYQKMTEHFFAEWFNQILKTPAYQSLLGGSYKGFKQLVLDKKESSYFLTFNYTPVLEDAYEIDTKHICHIHGKCNDSQLIVGHGDDDLPSDDDYDPEAFDFTEAKRQSRKPVKKIIEQHEDFFNLLSSVKNIYIIGSSILDDNPIDLPYLEKILSSVSAQVTVYLDSYEMTAVKKTAIEKRLKSLSSKVKVVEVIDSIRNEVLRTLPLNGQEH